MTGSLTWSLVSASTTDAPAAATPAAAITRSTCGPGAIVLPLPATTSAATAIPLPSAPRFPYDGTSQAQPPGLHGAEERRRLAARIRRNGLANPLRVVCVRPDSRPRERAAGCASQRRPLHPRLHREPHPPRGAQSPTRTETELVRRR